MGLTLDFLYKCASNRNFAVKNFPLSCEEKFTFMLPKILCTVIALAFAKAVLSQNQSSQLNSTTPIYVHAGHVLDAAAGKWQSQMTIVIMGDTIQSLQNGYKKVPASAQYHDLKSQWVMPGFIDMHVHIESETNPRRYMAQFLDDEADIAFDAVGYAEKTLLAGFTTVRDLGGSGVNIAIRDAINKGKIPGPRIYTAGKSLATTGGHADPTNGRNQELMGDPGPREGVVNSPWEGRKAVRQRYKNGADCIKITSTGGVLSVAKNGQNPQFTIEEIEAITSIAADYGMHVAAHAHGDEGMRRAVQGGVKTIEHGTYMSEETMDLMKERNCYLVPTITAGKEVAEKATVKDYYPEIVVPKALAIGPKIQDTFSRAYERGVPIVFGTDAGVYPHGQNAREFQYMTEAGMPVIEAIQTATVIPAEILKEPKLGQINTGFYADLVASDVNPEKDVATLQKLRFVMKGGVIYKR